MGYVPIFLLVALPALAFEAGGVGLGASERMVREHFPNAYCKPLEWKSEAADRRCDDARIRFAGVNARITFYLKDDAVEAFYVRFDPEVAKRVVASLRETWGAPEFAGREIVQRKDEEPRELYKARWKSPESRASLSAEREARRATLRVSRGDFEEKIYEVR